MIRGERTVEDPMFGTLTLTGDDAGWTVTGDRIGRTILHLDRDRTLETPVGSGPVDADPGLIRRKSHDVRVTVAGRDYHLRHRSPRRAELRCNGAVVGRFKGRWRFPLTKGPAMLRPYDPPRWAATADATDAGVGHVLVARWGAGAPGAVLNLLTIFS